MGNNETSSTFYQAVGTGSRWSNLHKSLRRCIGVCNLKSESKEIILKEGLFHEPCETKNLAAGSILVAIHFDRMVLRAIHFNRIFR